MQNVQGKNDWRNKLGHHRVEALLRVSEKGPNIENFNPDITVESWCNEKVRRLSVGPLNNQKRDLESENEDI